jgi:large subunit ribosomal protein L25
MPEITLTAEVGRQTGSAVARRLRTAGKVPAVVYGHGIDPLPVSIVKRELRAALHTEAGHNALINLEVEGGAKHLTIVKSLQRHPVRNDVIHVDFIVVNRDEVVTVEVPVLLEGEAKDVLSHDGNIDQNLYTITIQAKPGSIPNEIVIDISGMKVGDTIRVSDLKLPAGAATEMDPEEAIVVAQHSAVAVEAEQLEELAEAIAEAEAEGDEGEGGEDAEAGEGGDAPAAEASEDS